MPSQFSKLWLQDTQNRIAILRARLAIQSQGRALPCHVEAVNGAIVTVAFDIDPSPWPLPQITIPKSESPWIRMPTQIGEKGMTLPADAYLGGASGLGGGVADTSSPGNFSALVFVPISNSGSPPDDPNAAQVQGPNGAIIQTTSGTTSKVVTNTSGTVITFGSVTFTVNASGVTIDVNGTQYVFAASDATFNGTAFMTHVHSGVTTGPGDTGGVV